MQPFCQLGKGPPNLDHGTYWVELGLGHICCQARSLCKNLENGVDHLKLLLAGSDKNSSIVYIKRGFACVKVGPNLVHQMNLMSFFKKKVEGLHG
jgi:hypothetical protein